MTVSAGRRGAGRRSDEEVPVLTTSHTTTILPVADVERATHFYAEALGLADAGTSPDGMHLFRIADGERECDMIALRPAEPGAQSEHTVLSFEVPDIRREISDLERRGVRFQDYDMPGLRTRDHIADMQGEKAAWFVDTEGNILCLHQHVGG
ncbi:VOC family protein [Gandjariella thermophila]|uniref:Glyoxalase n=1 Tax=Gandjariella thermophila TaxID=1931992 RepID=A0A4D4J8H9_9PSEU|nr:VOC family protein [Gandjariella thermophila]GDY30183.1 glyoxalase [Gandjariella thermophila]